MTEIIAVMIGAILGYGAGWLQQRDQRARRRKGLASMMLLELRRAERSLREIAVSGPASQARAHLPLGAIDGDGPKQVSDGRFSA